LSKHGVEIIRFLKWRKKAKGKPILIRLYEIIYVGMLMLWSKRGKPPLDRVLHEYITRKEYDDDLASGKLFEKFIREIKETPCADNTGYYLENSSEILSFDEYKKLSDVKDKLIKRLSTKDILERYQVIHTYCRKYYNWVINKKKKDLEDITKLYNFETSTKPPMEI